MHTNHDPRFFQCYGFQTVLELVLFSFFFASSLLSFVMYYVLSFAWHCGRLFGFSDIWTYIRCCVGFFFIFVIFISAICRAQVEFLSADDEAENCGREACEWIPVVLSCGLWLEQKHFASWFMVKWWKRWRP